MKKVKNGKVIIILSIFIITVTSVIFFYVQNKNKRLENEKKMPYNFENISIPEVSDFSESLTNYAKTVEKISIYDSSDLQKENGKIEKNKYVEVFGYKDGVSKIKLGEKFYFVKSKNIENVSKDKNFKVIKGILLVNTEYGLPSDFDPKFDKFVEKQFEFI